MAMLFVVFVAYVLFCCGDAGFFIGFTLIILFGIAVTESWWILWALLALIIVSVAVWIFVNRRKKKKSKGIDESE